VYGEDALFIANEYNKTEATLTYLGSSKKKDAQLASQSINKGQLQTIIRDLLTNRMYKVEIWASKPNTSQWERIKKVPSYNMLDEDASIARLTLARALDQSRGTAIVRRHLLDTWKSFKTSYMTRLVILPMTKPSRWQSRCNHQEASR